jgi:tetratricopeptide (TPR) repeat protein
MILALQKSSKTSENVLKEYWKHLAKFLKITIDCVPSMPTEDVGDHDNSPLPGSTKGRSFLEEVSHMVCQVSWLGLRFHMESSTVFSFTRDTFSFVNRLLTSLYNNHPLSRKTTQATSAALSSRVQAKEIQYTRLRVSQFASRCWILLHNKPLSPDLIQDVTKDLLLLLNLGDNVVDSDVSSGALFFGSMIVWSGFVRTPWEFAIVPEARMMIAKTRISIKRAETLFRRKSHRLEVILLDIAEGDFEARGLTNKAAGLYKKVLKTDDLTASKDSASSLIRARCYLGLASLSASDPNTISADFPTKGLDILEGIPKKDLPFLLWKHTSTFEAGLRYQTVVAKQLISESLIHSGNMEQAGVFLRSSVEDAPMDETASFALGSFLLRLVFFHGHCSPESQKQAHVELLRAAKINPNAAGPFALLGYWYESKKDIKRAKGCYSKALLLEPWHPVAGRGVRRLESALHNSDLLRKAISSTSSLNGWAWHEVSRHKALIDCEDELAISALLKATRSRDIENPFSDPLAIFYSGPLAPRAPSHDELVLSLQDLAACYKRLGRCSAEVRTLHHALEVAAGSPSWSLLYACGQGKVCFKEWYYARVKILFLTFDSLSFS